MTKKQYQRYSPEFKIHALKRASEDGVTDKAVSEELGMSRRQLRRWRDQYPTTACAAWVLPRSMSAEPLRCIPARRGLSFSACRIVFSAASTRPKANKEIALIFSRSSRGPGCADN